MARLAGIEPTTPWFVAKYSIQLSYSREEKHYILFSENKQYFLPLVVAKHKKSVLSVTLTR